MSICQTNPTKKLTLITKVFVLKDLLLASQSVTGLTFKELMSILSELYYFSLRHLRGAGCP